MNINLATPTDPEDSIQSQIEEHREILAMSLGPMTNHSALIMENPDEFPGSYQVWSLLDTKARDKWVYVTPEGVVLIKTDPIWGIATASEGNRP